MVTNDLLHHLSWQDLLVVVLFIIMGGQDWEGQGPSCPLGGWTRGHQSLATHLPVTASVEELVWRDGVGGVLWGCVGQITLTSGWLWMRGWCCRQAA
jgi:hypothetical protein